MANHSANISTPEAELLLRNANRLAQANAALNAKPDRFYLLVLMLVPTVLAVAFGQPISSALGLPRQALWAVLSMFASVVVLGWQLGAVQRRLDALTQVVRSLQQAP